MAVGTKSQEKSQQTRQKYHIKPGLGVLPAGSSSSKMIDTASGRVEMKREADVYRNLNS